jgi:hypothetical protein
MFESSASRPLRPLHENALGAAACLLLARVHLHGSLVGVVRARVAALVRVAHLNVVPADLADNVIESLVDVDAGLGRRLEERAVERAGKSLTLCVT